MLGNYPNQLRDTMSRREFERRIDDLKAVHRRAVILVSLQLLLFGRLSFFTLWFGMFVRDQTVIHPQPPRGVGKVPSIETPTSRLVVKVAGIMLASWMSSALLTAVTAKLRIRWRLRKLADKFNLEDTPRFGVFWRLTDRSEKRTWLGESFALVLLMPSSPRGVTQNPTPPVYEVPPVYIRDFSFPSAQDGQQDSLPDDRKGTLPPPEVASAFYASPDVVDWEQRTARSPLLGSRRDVAPTTLRQLVAKYRDEPGMQERRPMA